jgi:hypothetical protein
MTNDRLVPIYRQTTIVERLEEENRLLRLENTLLKFRQAKAPKDDEYQNACRANLILRKEVKLLNEALAHERASGTASRLRQEIRKQQLTIEDREASKLPGYVPHWLKVQREYDARNKTAKENWQRQDDLDVTCVSGGGWTNCS